MPPIPLSITQPRTSPVLPFDPRDEFRLSPAFLDRYRGKKPLWGPLGEVTFSRTYPRFLEDLGRFETPVEVFARVTEAVMGTLANRAREVDAHWSAEKAQTDGQELFRRMWALKLLPAGRGLANLGTPALRWKGAAVLYNCSFVSTCTLREDIARPFAELMDYLMLGVGVGFDVRGSDLAIPVLAPVTTEDAHVVDDTREGWVSAVARLLRAFRGSDSLPSSWDYSRIRAKGVPLRTFGGVSSGPGPLRELIQTLTGLWVRRIGALVDDELIVDTANVIGRCVVAGGVRRSSEIALGPETGTFLGLKDPTGLHELYARLSEAERAHPEVSETIDPALSRLREAQALDSVLSDAFAAKQDTIDALSERRHELLASDSAWVQVNDELNRHPLRSWRWASNNSVLAKVGQSYDAISERIVRNGEPGLLWVDNVRAYGRMCDGDLTRPRVVTPTMVPNLRPDDATGVNPCQPAFAPMLTPSGIATMGDVVVGSTVWSGSRWTTVTRKVATGVKPVYAYRTTAGTFYGTADHRVVSDGVKVPAKDAETIDRCTGPVAQPVPIDPQDVLDGLVVGDGMTHAASNDLIVLLIGEKDDSYHSSEVAGLIGASRERLHPNAWAVTTTIDVLPKTYERVIPDRFKRGSRARVCGFLRGLYSANGSVAGGRVTLKASSRAVIDTAQEMLSSLGIGSYVTTNREHDTAFANGTYRCRESYDLNITTGRTLFRDLIGFLQPYKAAALQAACETGVSLRPAKVAYPVVATEYLGDMEVFDITVNADEHTYWTGGLLVSNCGEIALEDSELCNLVETFPGRHEDAEDWYRTLKFALFIGKATSLLPLHNPRTAEVQARNRRLGISISGIAEWYTRLGAPAMSEALDTGYRLLRRLDRLYSGWLEVPESVRLTTVKPSGTVSLLAGVEGGMRFPEASHVVRTIRIHDTSDLIPRLETAGYRVEPDRYAPNTVVAYFPLRDTRIGRTSRETTLWEQASLQALLQGVWADNSVSATLMFRRTEASDVRRVIAAHDKVLKGLSMLPSDDHGYAQPPYAPITEREYDAMNARLRPLDLDNLRATRDIDEKYCDGGVCSLPT